MSTPTWLELGSIMLVAERVELDADGGIDRFDAEPSAVAADAVAHGLHGEGEPVRAHVAVTVRDAPRRCVIRKLKNDVNFCTPISSVPNALPDFDSFAGVRRSTAPSVVVAMAASAESVSPVVVEKSGNVTVVACAAPIGSAAVAAMRQHVYYSSHLDLH